MYSNDKTGYNTILRRLERTPGKAYATLREVALRTNLSPLQRRRIVKVIDSIISEKFTQQILKDDKNLNK